MNYVGLKRDKKTTAFLPLLFLTHDEVIVLILLRWGHNTANRTSYFGAKRAGRAVILGISRHVDYVMLGIPGRG